RRGAGRVRQRGRRGGGELLRKRSPEGGGSAGTIRPPVVGRRLRARGRSAGWISGHQVSPAGPHTKGKDGRAPAAVGASAAAMEGAVRLRDRARDARTRYAVLRGRMPRRGRTGVARRGGFWLRPDLPRARDGQDVR